jgi:ABC-type uncharacterized transport system involved in gliding motility auxiliary subunit
MNKRTLSISGLIIAVILFVAVNILSQSSLRGARLDLTENRLFTVSEGTSRILAALDEPIVLRFFFSAKLTNQAPQLRTYGNRVRDLLQEYVNDANGKIRLEIIDPEPFSDAEDRAVGLGLSGIPINQSGDVFYFGLAGSNSTDDTEIIPFFQAENEEFLEYDLTKLVYGLSNPKKPVVGVISSYPLEFGPGGLQMAMRGQSNPYGILEAMRQFFDVRVLKKDTAAIEADVDILLLAHATDMPEQTLYAVDQFVLGGGRAMIFVDPYSETAAQIPPAPGRQPDPRATHSSDVKKLFDAWGIGFDTAKIVGDRTYATKVNAGRLGRRQILDYVSWLSLKGDAMNGEDVTTSQLTTVMMVSAGHITRAETAPVTMEPLIQSSANSMQIDTSAVRMRPDVEGLLVDFKPDEARYVLAARLNGVVKSAFDGPPPLPEKPKAETDDEAAKEIKPAKHIPASAEPINVIVVGDADMLDDRFWLRRQNMLGQSFMVPTSANADFLINSLDNLVGSNDLISLRSRGRSDRPFLVIESMRREAEGKFLAKEKELQKSLQETEQKIADLQSKSTGKGDAILSAEENQAIDGFRRQMLDTRRQLRNVQHDLRKDIETLQSVVKFANIGLVPLVVFLVAIVLALIRHQRRRASMTRRNA